MTIKTPLYGLEYIQQGEPIRNTRLALENNAYTIEAALAARGVPPTDLQALIAAGWFSDTGWVDITPAAGFAVASTAERPQMRRRAGQLIFQGGFAPTGLAVSASFTVATIPVPYRPAQNAYVGGGSSSGASTFTLLLTSAGALQIRTSATLGTIYKLDALSGILGA